MAFPSDLEIARAGKLAPLTEIAAQMGIGPHLLEAHGDELAKIRLEAIDELADRPKASTWWSRPSPDAARRRQDHDDRRSRHGDEAHRQAGNHQLAPAIDGPDLRHQGRRCRWRLQPGDPDGVAEPAPHRRLPRGDRCPQPAVGNGRQPPASGQRARPRHLQHHMAPRARCQRPCLAQHHRRARRQGRWRHAPNRLRHHRSLRSDGHLGAVDLGQRPARSTRTDRGRLQPCRRARDRRADQRRRFDGRSSCARR